MRVKSADFPLYSSSVPAASQIPPVIAGQTPSKNGEQVDI